MLKGLSVVRLGFAVLGLAAVVAQAVINLDAGRSMTNFFSFFTVESNILAAVMLAVTSVIVLGGRSSERPTLTMWRGVATLAMVMTGIIYPALLRNVDVQTDQAWINSTLHYVMPVILLLDWIITPRTRVAIGRAMIWLLLPLGYFAYSLIRGPIVGWYPYPFMNPETSSWGQVAINAVVIGIGIVVLAVLLAVIPARRTTARESVAP